MNNKKENKRIIELHFDDFKEKSFFKKLSNDLILKRISNSHSPYIILLKVFFAIFLALLADTYISKNPDSVSSTFTAILCISTTVTKGIKACISTFLMCCIGAIVSTLGNIICGEDAIFIWRVPLGTAITYYLMFLCHMEDDVGGLSAGAFSAIFVQLTLFQYNPLIKYTGKKWLHTFVVRLLSVFTGCVSSFIVNSFFDIIYYKFFFKTKLQHFSNNVTLYLHEFINEPENYLLESKYQLLNDLIVDINFAIDEINFVFFKGKSFIHYINRTEELENYKNLIYAYLRLLNHLSFLGYQKEIMNEEEIETVKKVVKQCIMKLYSHQFHMREVNFLEKIGYIELNNQSKSKNKNKTSKTTTEITDEKQNSKNIKNKNNKKIKAKTSDLALNSDGQSCNELINIEEINLNIINNEHNEENIPESLRIPLTAILKKTNTIIEALDHCKILKD